MKPKNEPKKPNKRSQSPEEWVIDPKTERDKIYAELVNMTFELRGIRVALEELVTASQSRNEVIRGTGPSVTPP